MADEAAAKGERAFLADRLEEATEHSTNTIALAPDNHIHYSRSPMYVLLRCYFQLLADAEKAVDLKADHTYGYFVLCSAHLGLGNTDSAVAAYKKSLTIGPSSEAGKAFLAVAQKTFTGGSCIHGGCGYHKPTVVVTGRARRSSVIRLHDSIFVGDHRSKEVEVVYIGSLERISTGQPSQTHREMRCICYLQNLSQ